MQRDAHWHAPYLYYIICYVHAHDTITIRGGPYQARSRNVHGMCSNAQYVHHTNAIYTNSRVTGRVMYAGLVYVSYVQHMHMPSTRTCFVIYAALTRSVYIWQLHSRPSTRAVRQVKHMHTTDIARPPTTSVTSRSGQHKIQYVVHARFACGICRNRLQLHLRRELCCIREHRITTTSPLSTMCWSGSGPDQTGPRTYCFADERYPL